MKGLKRAWLGLCSVLLAWPCFAQTAAPVRAADERYKVDILLVVAHPDDEGAVTPYLARAIYDLHKRVAVVYATRGGSGGNEYSSERGPALADMREIEAREACARLGISRVWFLDGRDTASQNVLNSLANWGHGANLEKLVELIRLTRPDILISSLPGMFFGENHGDHQAAGVLATEAFDLAARADVFPAQLAAASPKRELYQENLNPFQPKKLYYFADASDPKQFAGSGPAYSITEVSASGKKPYWRLALDAAMTHLTQYPGEIHSLLALSDAEIAKRMSDPEQAWWTDPDTLIFGKAAFELSPAQATDDVFADFAAKPFRCPMLPMVVERAPGAIVARIGGPWGFYDEFRSTHCLGSLPSARIPEIAVKAGSVLNVPVTIYHDPAREQEVTISVALPAGWKAVGGTGKLLLPAEERSQFELQVETPGPAGAERKDVQPEILSVRIESNGQAASQLAVRVLLKSSALPQ